MQDAEDFQLPGSLSEIQKELEDLRKKCIEHPENCCEIVSDAPAKFDCLLADLSSAEDETQRQEECTHHTLNILPDMIALYDPDCRFRFVNSGLAELWRTAHQRPCKRR